MTEELNDNQGADAGEDAAAKTAAAAPADGASDGAKSDDGEETITIKKSELRKIEEDRDNYKNIGLKKKADERSLHPDSTEPGAGTGAAAVDEKKVDEVATAATKKTMREAAEKTAKRSFLKAHPEYVDDAQWTVLLSHLTFKGNELTADEISDRMEAAVLEHKRSTGKLDDYLKSERERGVREGRIQEQVGSGHISGATGDRTDGSKTGQLSEKGREMAKAMHVDPDKVAQIDPTKNNEIGIDKV